MYKLVGYILGLFFIISGTIRFLSHTEFMYTQVFISLITGILFLLNTFLRESASKIIQICMGTFYGSCALFVSPVFSLAPLLFMSVLIPLFNKYFISKAPYVYLLLLPYLLASIYAGWTLHEVTLSLLVFTAYTTILYIIYNTKS